MHPIRLFLVIGMLSIQGLSAAGQNLDVTILQSLNKNTSSFKDHYLELHASSVSYVSLGTPAYLLVRGLIKQDKSLQRDGLYMAGSYLLSGSLTRLLKMTCKRIRPYERYKFIIRRDDEAGGYSFPSGHTSAAFNIATSLALRYPKWQVIVPAYLYAGTVAWARVYQGVHYPSDVLAGALVGAGSAWLVHRWQTKIEKRKLGLKHEALAVLAY